MPGSGVEWTPRSMESDDPAAPVENDLVLDDVPPGPVEILLVTASRTRVQRIDVVAGKTVDCVFGE